VGYNSVFDTDAIYYIHFHTGQPYTYNSAKEMDEWPRRGTGHGGSPEAAGAHARFQRFIVEQAYCADVRAVHHRGGLDQAELRGVERRDHARVRRHLEGVTPAG
jgi:hypothetical protein